ncbi:hypothetical protein B0I35DRAFT_357491 [Stachybotrys elegans]|uniref:TauD/TfdA-like domain-containing protein n=1 Tax=Stachybotrys elegans TaxID=80388 RepID=A0A8K0WMR8_9HYPO|nr:hypothetical protein B0I35DRAFT_357491 [Stachybotrys elegans]
MPQSLLSNRASLIIQAPRRRRLATESHPIAPIVSQLDVHDLGQAKCSSHLHDVDAILKHTGILKIRLGFVDNESSYLQQLITGLSQQHGHQLPISHSATRGWFWDVRPSFDSFQTANHQARSETMERFPWHTDCSYEDPTPRYFALQVIQHDRRGGGTLSVMNVERLVSLLPSATREALSKAEFESKIPPEFIKNLVKKSTICSLLSSENALTSNRTVMRFREDILAPLTERAGNALAEMRQALRAASDDPASTLHLSSERDMPTGTILLVDNRRWLHARNEARDQNRHLRRVRWDAVPF